MEITLTRPQLALIRRFETRTRATRSLRDDVVHAAIFAGFVTFMEDPDLLVQLLTVLERHPALTQGDPQ